MDPEGSHKYPNQDQNQPGLEVNPSYYAPKTTWAVEQTAPLTASGYGQPQAPIYQSRVRKTILGLSVAVFWGLVALLVVILAAGIGGGVGAGLASRKSTCPSDTTNLQPTACTNPPSSSTGSSSSSSSTTSSTTSSAASSTVSPAPSSPCSTPNANGSTISPLDSTGKQLSLNGIQQNFLVLCNTNWPSTATFGNPDVSDLMKVWMPDLASCIALCAEYNAGLENNGGKSGYCQAVTLLTTPGEFCYLKNATGNNITSNNSGLGVVSAKLE